MNLKQLEYFVAIVEEGQVTAAARRLHISQPPLSYELAQLERELGCKLVHRGPRGVTPTDAGRLLYERAAHILAMATATAVIIMVTSFAIPTAVSTESKEKKASSAAIWMTTIQNPAPPPEFSP